MDIELESARDLSLDAETAENVIGGRGTRATRSRHLAKPFSFKSLPPVVQTAPSDGLGMGPDPGYPSADNGDDGC
jgi:hypothetical protein